MRRVPPSALGSVSSAERLYSGTFGKKVQGTLRTFHVPLRVPFSTRPSLHPGPVSLRSTRSTPTLLLLFTDGVVKGRHKSFTQGTRECRLRVSRVTTRRRQTGTFFEHSVYKKFRSKRRNFLVNRSDSLNGSQCMGTCYLVSGSQGTRGQGVSRYVSGGDPTPETRPEGAVPLPLAPDTSPKVWD